MTYGAVPSNDCVCALTFVGIRIDRPGGRVYNNVQQHWDRFGQGRAKKCATAIQIRPWAAFDGGKV